MIESIQKFASKVCLKQWSRNTRYRYQDMLEFLNMPSLAARRTHRKRCTLYKIVNNLSECPSPPLIPRNPYYPSCSVHCLSFVCTDNNIQLLFPWTHILSLYTKGLQIIYTKRNFGCNDHIGVVNKSDSHLPFCSYS